MRKIPMLDLTEEYKFMKEEIDSAIHRCLTHQKWIYGPEIKEFEDSVAEYTGVKHCIGVSSGTEALVISMRSLAIKLKGEEYFNRDDEILTTPFTFTATGDSILRAGATPVFIDIDPLTYNIDTKKIREYLSSSSPDRVVGIVPVHLYGEACNMDDIMAIAEEYSLFVVEDVAQAFGAAWMGVKLGKIGDAGAFSFFPSKNLGAFGDAGMIATDDDEIADIARMLIKHGGKDKYNVDYIGYNARMDTLQAAVLLAKFPFIDELNEKRRQIAAVYNRELHDIEGLLIPSGHSANDTYHVFHQYTIKTPGRDELRAFLEDNGISTMVYYPVSLHNMKVFEGRMKAYGHLANAEKATREVLSLPVEPLQSEEDTMFVAETVNHFFSRHVIHSVV